MKKALIFALACLISIASFAQTDTTKTKFSHYVCLGLSMTNTSAVNTFKYANYPSIENGVVYKNIGLAGIVGYRDLNKIGKSIDSVYYEFKTYVLFPIGELTGQLLFGWGGYIRTEYTFIEYGVGISYTVGKFSYGVTYSNWDAGNYITPSITYNF